MACQSLQHSRSVKQVVRPVQQPPKHSAQMATAVAPSAKPVDTPHPPGATYGICEGFCNVGAVTCTTPITACCNANEMCGADGTCTAGYGATSTAPRVTATASNPAPSLTFAPVASAAMTLPLSASTSIDDFWSSESVYESSLAASESSWEASFDASTSSYWASYDASQSMAGASAAASGSPVAASLSATSPATAAAAASVIGASGDGAQLAVGRDGLRFFLGMLTLPLWWG